jgi:hypothetical protein
MRASGRGEAVRAHVERHPHRLASRVLGSTCVRFSRRQSFVHWRMVLKAFGLLCASRGSLCVANSMGFKECE